MATTRALFWLDTLAWTLIYGGLLLLTLGIATGPGHLIAGWSMGVVGGVAAAAGAVVIWIRSRLRDNGEAGAQSNQAQGNP